MRLAGEIRRFNFADYGDSDTARVAAVKFHEVASKMTAQFQAKRGQDRF